MRRRVRKFEDLPVNAQRYVEYIEKTLGVPINFIGVGPSREAVILRYICLLQHTPQRERLKNRLHAAGQELLAGLRRGALHARQCKVGPRSTANSPAGREPARCNAAENRPFHRWLAARSSI